MAKKPKALILCVGAERGIGGAASRRFAREGYHVLVAGRRADKINSVVDTIRKEGGSRPSQRLDAGDRSARIRRRSSQLSVTPSEAEGPLLSSSKKRSLDFATLRSG